MTSRERVLAAMRHQRPDRTPFDFSWGFAPAQLHRFQDATGAADPDDYFGADTRLLRPSPTRLATDFSCYLGDLPPGAQVDEWGIGRRPSASTDAAHAHLDGFIYPLLACRAPATPSTIRFRTSMPTIATRTSRARVAVCRRGALRRWR